MHSNTGYPNFSEFKATDSVLNLKEGNTVNKVCPKSLDPEVKYCA